MSRPFAEWDRRLIERTRESSRDEARKRRRMEEEHSRASSRIYRPEMGMMRRRRSRWQKEWPLSSSRDQGSLEMMKMKHPTRIHLPEDIILSILSKLSSYRQVTRLKIVCKSWNALISDPCINHSLIQGLLSRHPRILLLHRSHFNGQSCRVGIYKLYPYQVTSSYTQVLVELPFPFEEGMAMRPLHCDGLLLLSSLNNNNIYICNPATASSSRQGIVSLPPGSPDARLSSTAENIVGFGFDPFAKKYTAVRCFYRHYDPKGRSSSLGLERFTLGSTSWQQSAVDPPYPILPSPPVFLAGALYWMIDNNLHTSPPAAILQFHLKGKKFGVIPPPLPPKSGDPSAFQKEATLTVLDGNLCCTNVSYRIWQADIWMSSHFVSHSWELICSIRLQPDPNMSLHPHPYKFQPIMTYRGEILIRYHQDLRRFDPHTRTERRINDTRHVEGDIFSCFQLEDSSYEVTHYVSSMLSSSK